PADLRHAPDAPAVADRGRRAARRHPDLDRRTHAVGTDRRDRRTRPLDDAARARADGVAVGADADPDGLGARTAVAAGRRRDGAGVRRRVPRAQRRPGGARRAGPVRAPVARDAGARPLAGLAVRARASLTDAPPTIL